MRGDVLGIEILESGGGRVVDELVIGLADANLVDLLITEVSAVDGVSVEHVRPIEGDRVDPDLMALASGAELAEATTRGVRLDTLVDVGGIRITGRRLGAPRAAELRPSPHAGRRAVGRTGCARCSPAAVTSATRTSTASDLFWSDMPASGHVARSRPQGTTSARARASQARPLREDRRHAARVTVPSGQTPELPGQTDVLEHRLVLLAGVRLPVRGRGGRPTMRGRARSACATGSVAPGARPASQRVDVLFRPEEVHRASGEDDVVPPRRGRHEAVEQQRCVVGPLVADRARDRRHRSPAHDGLDPCRRRGARRRCRTRPRRSWRTTTCRPHSLDTRSVRRRTGWPF